VAGQEVAVVVPGEEAGLLALRARRGGEASRARLGPGLVLRLRAEGEPKPWEEAGVDSGKHVGLVFRWIRAAREEQAAAMLGDAGVVAGREPRRADPRREREQRGEAETSVAAHARVRRLAARIAPDEWVDDRLPKGLAQIERDVREAERLARFARRDNRGRRAANALGVLPRRIGPQPQRHSDRLAAGVAHVQERDGAVDSAAHGDGDSLLPRRRGHGRPERVVESVRREALAGNRSGVQEGSPLDLSKELTDAGPLALSGLDALPGHGEPHPGEISVPGGVAYELTMGGHEKDGAPPRR